MDAIAELRKAAVVFELTVWNLLTTRRVIVTALLASVPLLIVAAIVAAGVRTYNIVLFQGLMVPLFLQVVLIFVTLVQAGSLVREEVEDETLPFLLTRPIPRPAIVLYKYMGYAVA